MNNLKKYIEKGRSMVEILGVLAVAGVLSVGGISGYRFAMDKYRANDIANEVNLRNRDTWYRYQTKDLPLDEDIIGEWSNTTATGFPISVVPRSRLMFDVWVDEVPSKVCKNVLNMNIIGPLFIWTTNDDGATRHLYDGTNPEICGNEETKSLVFTTTLEEYNEEGLREGLTDDFDRPIRYCLAETECRAGCETCFDRDPYTCNSICANTTPICRDTGRKTDEGQPIGECVECEIREDCPAGQACNEHYKCEPLPEECPAGTFRSRGGACVSCKSPTNVRVSKEKFEKDTLSGVDMCNACATAEGDLAHGRNLEVDKNENYYCSYACTVGVSVQSKYKITLLNEDGTPVLDDSGNEVKTMCRPCWDTRRVAIANDLESKKQCTSCGNDWYTANNDYWCVKDPFNCPKGEVRRMYGNDYSCVPCNSGSFWFVGSNTASFAKRTLEDKNCEECTEAGTPRKVYILHGGWPSCTKLCEQPDENSEESTICLTDPRNEKCERKFMDGSVNTCYPCSYTGSTGQYTYWSKDTYDFLKDLCEKCGRKFNDAGYCIFKDISCSIGKFMGGNGSCYDCASNTAVDITTDEESGCTANCKKKDGEYSSDADAVAIRQLYIRSNWAGQKFNTCVAVCGDNAIRNSGSTCSSCKTTGTIRLPNDKDDGSCAENCPDWHVVQYHGLYCTSPNCPQNEGNPAKRYYKNRYANCTACDSGFHGDDDCAQTNTTHPSEGKQLCEACGNRIVTPNGCCRPLDPGTSGLCNNIDITQLPTDTNEDLKTKAEPYLRGDYNGKLFLDNSGYCRSCTNTTTYSASKEQCESCGNRRRSGDSCIYGLCTDGTAFPDSSSTCIDCSTTAQKTEIKSGMESLCTACSGKRVMTDADDKSYCVAECSGQWQNLAGKCLSDTAGKAEIGTDSISRNLCTAVKHVVYSVGDHWYCSDKPKTDYFINSAGTNKSCSDNGDILIPNTQDAKVLCLGKGADSGDESILSGDAGCSSGQRAIKINESDDTTVYCIKNG